jgi:hypothetical protein
MTINPVDMQVLVPRVGEAGKVNRVVQNQQQTEQQIMNQIIRENITNQEHVVNQMHATEQNIVQADEKKKKRYKETKESIFKKNESKEEENVISPDNKDIGTHLDIKI